MKKSDCCGAGLLWEVVGGMRVTREVSGRDVYGAQCSECRLTFTVDVLPKRTRVRRTKGGPRTP